MSDLGIVGLKSWEDVQKYHDQKMAEKNTEIQVLKELIKEFCGAIPVQSKTPQLTEIIKRAKQVMLP